MNKSRRKELGEIIDKLIEIKERLEIIAEEERDAYDNLPENLLYSERGEAMSENADDIERASDDVEDIIDNINEIIER